MADYSEDGLRAVITYLGATPNTDIGANVMHGERAEAQLLQQFRTLEGITPPPQALDGTVVWEPATKKKYDTVTAQMQAEDQAVTNVMKKEIRDHSPSWFDKAKSVSSEWVRSKWGIEAFQRAYDNDQASNDQYKSQGFLNLPFTGKSEPIYKDGTHNPPLDPTGQMDDKTKAVIKQLESPQQSSGTFDPAAAVRTAASNALAAAKGAVTSAGDALHRWNSNVAAAATLDEPLKGTEPAAELIRKAQIILAESGYKQNLEYTRTNGLSHFDGIKGARTEADIVQLQYDNHLRLTGDLDAKTIKVLNEKFQQAHTSLDAAEKQLIDGNAAPVMHAVAAASAAKPAAGGISQAEINAVNLAVSQTQSDPAAIHDPFSVIIKHLRQDGFAPSNNKNFSDELRIAYTDVVDEIKQNKLPKSQAVPKILQELADAGYTLQPVSTTDVAQSNAPSSPTTRQRTGV